MIAIEIELVMGVMVVMIIPVMVVRMMTALLILVEMVVVDYLNKTDGEKGSCLHGDGSAAAEWQWREIGWRLIWQ